MANLKVIKKSDDVTNREPMYVIHCLRGRNHEVFLYIINFLFE
jgi:hypothetical protein